MRLSKTKTKTRRRINRKKTKMTKRKLIVKKTTRRLRLKNKNKRKIRRYVGGSDWFGTKKRREAKEALEIIKANEYKFHGDRPIEEAESWKIAECSHIKNVEIRDIDNRIQEIDDKMNIKESFGSVRNSDHDDDYREPEYIYISKSINDFINKVRGPDFTDNRVNRDQQAKMTSEGEALDKEKENLLIKRKKKVEELEQRNCDLNELSTESSTDPEFDTYPE